MTEDTVDYSTVRKLWAIKSVEEDNRWTGPDLLQHEIELLNPLAQSARSILDLGSGHGKLSRRLAGETINLVAVDFEGGFGVSFTAHNHEFHTAPATSFDSTQRFDLILAMGLVTYLNSADEQALYEVCVRQVSASGTAIIKNQCGRQREVVINGFSKDLNQEYSARYPYWEDQLRALRDHFGSVDLIHYPERFNKWDDTFHVAFKCRP